MFEYQVQLEGLFKKILQYMPDLWHEEMPYADTSTRLYNALQETEYIVRQVKGKLIE